MKIIFSILICLVSQIGFSQQIEVYGKVLSKESNEPIYGVAILLEDNYLGFSDNEGFFSFKINESDHNKKVVFNHLSFNETKINISDLLLENNIYIESKINSLDEVVLEAKKNNDINKTLKNAYKLFDKTYVDYPYWSELDYKHLIYLDGEPHSFMQIDGHILMVGSKESNPFIDASIIPNEIRRTKESETLVKSWFSKSDSKDFSKAQLGGDLAKTSWTDYRFVESVHPLSSKGQKYFDISYNNVIKSDKYLILDFIQKKDINIATRWLDYMTGQIWLNKKNFKIHKLVTNYRFEKIFLINFDIIYTEKQEKIFPSIVKKTKYSFNSYDKKNSKITVSSLTYFKKIYDTKRENYRKKFMSPWYTFSEVYNSEYWKDVDINELKYFNGLLTIADDKSLDSLFQEGCKTKEYSENFPKDLKGLWESKGLEFKELMLKDIKE